MKKRIGLLSLLALLFLCMPVGSALADTTVMMYMCGTDLYEDCITDMEEICAATYGNEVTVYVQAGGAKKWGDSRLKNGSINRFEIRNGSFSKVKDLGKGNMGNVSTLSSFVLDTLNEHPADRYVLVLWDHGSGSSEGICFDETAGDDSLSVKEVAEALKAVRDKRGDFHLDILGMDACLMACLEAADAMTPYADYLVASEELEPYLGWYYTPWLTALGKDPQKSTADICIDIVEAYMDACLKDNPKDYVTLSAVDLRKVEALSGLTEQFFEKVRSMLAENGTASVTRLRQKLYSYGSFDKASSDMVDLDAFLEAFSQVDPNLASECRKALAECVLYCRKSATLTVANGLSVLIPMDTASKTKTYADQTTDGSLPVLVAFMKEYAAALKGGSYSFSSPAVSQVDLTGPQGSNSFFESLNFIGFIPAGSAGNNISGSTGGNTVTGAPPIAGVVNTSPNGSTANQPVPNVPIAGTAGGSTVSPTGVPIAGTATGTAVTGTSQQAAPFFIAGTAGGDGDGIYGIYDTSATISEEILETASAGNAYAYSMNLSTEDMEHLSYVEGQLLMNASDEEDIVLIDLGSNRDAWVDWKTGVAYSLFDGTWPTLDGQLLYTMDQSVNGVVRRSLAMVTVNGKDTYLVIIYRNGEKTGEILGISEGFDSNGLPVRGVRKLRDGDVIVPVYDVYQQSNEADDEEAMDYYMIEGDPITWHEGMTVGYEPLPGDGTAYLYSFALHDIYGESSLSDFIDLTIK